VRSSDEGKGLRACSVITVLLLRVARRGGGSAEGGGGMMSAVGGRELKASKASPVSSSRRPPCNRAAVCTPDRQIVGRWECRVKGRSAGTRMMRPRVCSFLYYILLVSTHPDDGGPLLLQRDAPPPLPVRQLRPHPNNHSFSRSNLSGNGQQPVVLVGKGTSEHGVNPRERRLTLDAVLSDLVAPL
jgi:hypothetical protein